MFVIAFYLAGFALGHKVGEHKAQVKLHDSLKDKQVKGETKAI
jgi:hypothetical protein